MSKPIPHRFYRAPSGVSFSLYSAAIPPGSELVEAGFTVQHPDGTTGLGRKPFATLIEAQAWCDAHPNFPGMSQG